MDGYLAINGCLSEYCIPIEFTKNNGEKWVYGFHGEIEKGIEIIVKGKIVYKDKMKPVQNLNVNGAGDIYAGFFIQNYFKKDLKDSAQCAMLETTRALLKRKNNEEV